MAKFLKNTWYVAAWGSEVERSLMARTILDEPVVMYRKENGEAVAISGVCPHRFAPLGMGKLIGDRIQCGYHGLEFDGNGRCVHNPHGNHAIPASAHIRKYPLVERHNLLWIWMGLADNADESLIADFSYLTSPKRKTLGGTMRVHANYEVLTDNLMDPSHAQYVHGQFLATGAYQRGTLDMVQEGKTVAVKNWLPNGPVPKSYKGYLPGDESEPVDMWIEFYWQSPSLIHNSTGITPTGRPRAEGVEKIGTHILTPETEFSTHYFYGNSRSFKLDDPVVDEQIREWHRIAFTEEDAPMLEATQRMMGKTSDLMSLRPVLLAIDAAPMRARRALARAIADEEKAWPVAAEKPAPALRAAAQ